MQATRVRESARTVGKWIVYVLITLIVLVILSELFAAGIIGTRPAEWTR